MKLSPPPLKKTSADASYDILTVVSLNSQVCQDVTLCDWLCINQYFNGTYCLELQNQAVMQTQSDLED